MIELAILKNPFFTVNSILIQKRIGKPRLTALGKGLFSAAGTFGAFFCRGTRYFHNIKQRETC